MIYLIYVDTGKGLVCAANCLEACSGSCSFVLGVCALIAEMAGVSSAASTVVSLVRTG